jgi:hypothetical protein
MLQVKQFNAKAITAQTADSKCEKSGWKRNIELVVRFWIIPCCSAWAGFVGSGAVSTVRSSSRTGWAWVLLAGI